MSEVEFHFGTYFVVSDPTFGSDSETDTPDHVASPDASEVSTLPSHGVPPVIFTCPLTSSLAHGDGVPIPTLPLLIILICSERAFAVPV